ncbi:MAG TPA: efflux RND transporter periplasmic adaptor subunit [Syntrophobacteraceae bacterium]|nr:efflux RND transporter periplasmic adaptor subunit [Syntrophobacteraceae bacterium]HBZ54582.1 efflux RND transporter periplasmic adaptor subunit [Syntrophobacteraceae bacterium]
MEPDRLSKLAIERKEFAGPRRRRWVRRAVMTLLLVAAMVVLVQLYRRGVLTPASEVKVTLLSLVYPSQVITDLNSSGYVVPQSKAAVASKGTGRLVALEVHEGSRVKKGDILARLESDDLQADVHQTRSQLAAGRAALEQAQSEMSTAEKNWYRYKTLAEQQFVAQADADIARDRWAKARAGVESAQANIKALQAASERAEVLLEFMRIRAPFDGVVLTKNADIGEVVAPFGSATNAKAAVVTMADMGTLLVETDVSEAFIGKVRLGQACEIQLDALGRERFPGKVDIIVPTADRTKGTVLVKVSFDQLDPRVLPEMSARVAFLNRPLNPEENQPVLGVHRDALTKIDGIQGFFLLKGEHAQWVALPHPEFLGDYAILAAPFKAGDSAVLKPPAKLRPEARVKVAD